MLNIFRQVKAETYENLPTMVAFRTSRYTQSLAIWGISFALSSKKLTGPAHALSHLEGLDDSEHTKADPLIMYDLTRRLKN